MSFNFKMLMVLCFSFYSLRGVATETVENPEEKYYELAQQLVLASTWKLDTSSNQYKENFLSSSFLNKSQLSESNSAKLADQLIKIAARDRIRYLTSIFAAQLLNDHFEEFNIEDLSSMKETLAEITEGEVIDYPSLLGVNAIRSQILLSQYMGDAAVKKHVNDASSRVASLLVTKANPSISRKIREFKANEIVLDKDELQNNLMSIIVFAYQSYQELIQQSLIDDFDALHEKISKNIAEDLLET